MTEAQMASKEDGAKVDKAEYTQAGIVVDIRLNKQKGLFNAEWGDKRWTNADLTTIKQEIVQFLRDSTTTEWKPIIITKATGTGFYSGKDNEWVGLEIDRCYIGVIAGAHRRVDWETAKRYKDDMLRYSKSFYWRDNGREFTPPITDHVGEDRVYSYSSAANEPNTYLPYTDETWAGLNVMQERIKQIRERIQLILSTAQGHQLINALAAQLQLTAPTEE
jgi:hypothetical protein